MRELEVTEHEDGYYGGGGVRLAPPKLSAPPNLQMAPLPVELETALKHDYEVRFGTSGVTLHEVDELANLLLDRYEEQGLGSHELTVMGEAKGAPLDKTAASDRIIRKEKSVRSIKPLPPEGSGPPGSPSKMRKGQAYRIRDTHMLASGWDGGGGVRLDPMKLNPRKAREPDAFERQVLSAADAVAKNPELYSALVGPEIMIQHLSLAQGKDLRGARKWREVQTCAVKPAVRIRRQIKVLPFEAP